MRIHTRQAQDADSSDATLVLASLRGDRDAFGKIVTRYQSLLCSLAYSSVGDLSHSEDIAQEAFVEAWAKLDHLREPEKLKSWLCGILRFKVSRYRRKEARQPARDAEQLDERDEYAEETRMEQAAIREEEQALLWQAMERVPATYREPLILFFREHRSVKQVAQELDLSEDAVKQRLSRGRKLLQEGVMAFVEKTLAKSKPGAAFTTGVLAGIAIIPPPAKAAAYGAAAVKAGSWLKWANVAAILASFSGIASTLFGVRASLDQSRTKEERRRVVKVAATLFFSPVAFIAALFILRQLALGSHEHTGAYAIASQLLALGFVVAYPVLVIRMLKETRQLRARQRELHPEAFEGSADRIGSKQREYKSRLSIAGVPLVHFRFGMPEEHDAPVFGWIAGGGDRAYGLLFAWGGVAVAPVSVGIVAFGVIGIGALGLGCLGIGTVGVGLIAFGASAIAYNAYASLSALGWQSAFSQGFSLAKEAAIGLVAHANHINNEQAAEIMRLAALDASYLLILSAVAVLVIVPAAWHSNTVRRRMRRS